MPQAETRPQRHRHRHHHRPADLQEQPISRPLPPVEHDAPSPEEARGPDRPHRHHRHHHRHHRNQEQQKNELDLARNSPTPLEKHQAYQNHFLVMQQHDDPASNAPLSAHEDQQMGFYLDNGLLMLAEQIAQDQKDLH